MIFLLMNIAYVVKKISSFHYLLEYHNYINPRNTLLQMKPLLMKFYLF